MNIADKIERDIALAHFTTFRIGGQAKLFVQAETPDEIIAAIRWARENNEKFFILGGGSNVLVGDKGFDGLIIKNNYQHLFREGTDIICGSGLALARVSLSARRNSLAGLEWAVGIPGTVGGAVAGNAGAYGCSISDILETADVYLVNEDKMAVWSAADFGFAYRFSKCRIEPIVVLSARLKLKPGKIEEMEAKIKDHVAKRMASQPKHPSAGCVFRNVPVSELSGMDSETREMAESEGAIRNGKLSAAWLVERLHFKGKWVGGARVSEDHANYIVNEGSKATADDVLMLMSLIKQKVRVEFEVQLKEEITYLN